MRSPMIIAILTLILLTMISCTGGQEPELGAPVSSTWTPNEAIARLAFELHETNKSRIVAMGELGVYEASDAWMDMPVTGDWKAERDIDDSWIVTTDTQEYRLFESGSPTALISNFLKIPSLNPSVEKGDLASVKAGGTIGNTHMDYCKISTSVASASRRTLGGGTGVEIIDWRFNCVPKLVRVEVVEKADTRTNTYWVKLDDLNLED